MPRLFIAIDLPDQVKIALSRLSGEVPGVRWVGAAEIHLTLRFIGEVSPQVQAELGNALSAIRFQPFALSLAGVGHFPPHGHPRVLWVGLGKEPELVRLQQRIESAVQQAAIPPEERPFSPHITLARLKETPPAAVTRFEEAHHGLAFDPFQVEEFILYSSVLTPRGAIHRKEAVYRLS